MRKRLIPVLLLDRRRRLVKTIGFRERTYVGDPLNVIRLFNEREVDEICVLDIDATKDGRSPDFNYLEQLASECFMPLAYGGGISSIQHCETLNRLGVEKFVFGTATTDTELLRSSVNIFGSQAIVASVDVRSDSAAGPKCYVRNGTTLAAQSPLDHCKGLADLGVGELILQSIDQDGRRQGYDIGLLKNICSELSIPIVALGGAGNVQHCLEALKAGANAAASGSAFTFIGRLRAVLIHYPDQDEIERLSRAVYA